MATDISLKPVYPSKNQGQIHWGQLRGCAAEVLLAETARAFKGLILLVTPDTHSAYRAEEALKFFGLQEQVMIFPDWETLPYDVFSPHEDIVSQRLETLYRLPKSQDGILITPVATLMQRLAPTNYVQAHSLVLENGDAINREELRQELETAGYRYVSQVMEHGEFTTRGSLIDLFPMGSDTPYRIDLFDEEIESIRSFDPETQRTCERIEEIKLLPAHEFPLNPEGIKTFRQNYRAQVEGDLQRSQIYKAVSDNNVPAGIEYYQPLFFEQTATLFDYLPEKTLLFLHGDIEKAAQHFSEIVAERYEQRRYDIERPLLEPKRLFLKHHELLTRLDTLRTVQLSAEAIDTRQALETINYPITAIPNVLIRSRAERPLQGLEAFLAQGIKRVLFTAESAGRREHLYTLLHEQGFSPTTVSSWEDFLTSTATQAITVAPLEDGFYLHESGFALIPEQLLFGEHVQQRRRRRSRATRDADAIIQNLNDLREGAPVVHEEHGVGRYLGLQKLNVGDMESEFLMLEYARGDKLYVPVSSLHLISRYTGASPETAPLHKLGTDQWSKAKRKAAEKAHDVAAELLEIHAKRAARKGHIFPPQEDDYQAFATAFPFEETPDQADAIEAVRHDMLSEKSMDRVVCGDVGFGKTEVAMRAAFTAANSGKQVAILAPTTLLVQQHLQNFRDRFADWPMHIESLSRFRTKKQVNSALEKLAAGLIDIVIGTHKLLQPDIKFKNLGLVIVDEEHRFGVRHKEQLKKLRANVDLLTLTATPIPRTLNMSLSGLRDLSIIATPPVQRHAIKTFVNEWNKALIQEACAREISRGGQVYFLHNEVKTIDKTTRELQEILPDISIRFAHGQMRERELEQIMQDFYHQRFQMLVATTIIESGIDVPTANTIIINRADKLGLAQLHQIRGRVGRSHHRAYAYLITPHPKSLTADAKKRLEALESLEDLGVGFTLATHDMEIRGAGELLGEGQSGQIHEIGFTLYNDLLERAVKTLKAGKVFNTDLSHEKHITTIALGAPALLPDDYVPDVHTRLILYKRIANATDQKALKALRIEFIDRFGLLPEAVKTLFEVTRLKLEASKLGVHKVELSAKGGRVVFDEKPAIDVGKLIALIQRRPWAFQLKDHNKLRITKDLDNVQERIESLDEVFREIAP